MQFLVCAVGCAVAICLSGCAGRSTQVPVGVVVDAPVLDRVPSFDAGISDGSDLDAPHRSDAASSGSGDVLPVDSAVDTRSVDVVQSGSLTRWTYIAVDSARGPSRQGYGMFGVGFGDIDGDDDIDIACGRYVYLNLGTLDFVPTFTRLALPADPTNGNPIDASLIFDVDGDGIFDDILAEDLPNVVWTRFRGVGAVAFNIPRIVTTMPPTAHLDGRTVKIARIFPGSTRPDIILTGGDGIHVLSVPENPQSREWPIIRITESTFDEQKPAGLGDVDLDGALDVASTLGAGQNAVAWWRNPRNASVVPWQKSPVGETKAQAKMVELGDLTGDTLLDVVATEEANPAGIYLFVRPKDLASQAPWERTIVDSGLSQLDSLSLGDVNNDGHLDIVVAETVGLKRVLIYENLGLSTSGSVAFRRHAVDAGKEIHNGARLVDLNRDGRLDIVGAGYYDYATLHVWLNEI